MAITSSTSLREFRANYSAVKLPLFTNKETGECFHSLAFMSKENPKQVACLVGFSSKLGELTAEEIKTRQAELRVIQLESGSYKLCAGTEFEDWQDVDI